MLYPNTINMSSKLASSASRESSFFGAVSRAFTKPKALPKLRLDGQTAIITGGNVGLGLEAGRQLLSLGLTHLILGVRSQIKGDEAASQLRKNFPSKDVIISVWIVDMASYDSVRAFAEQCATLPFIDMVMLNAGVMMNSYTTIPNTGRETTLQVNYLSTVLLAMLLVPILRSKRRSGAAQAPVLSLIGSDTHYQDKFWPRLDGNIFEQFDEKERFSFLHWYGMSKFLLTFFASSLAELVDSADVVINVANPGGTRGTGLIRDSSGVLLAVQKAVHALLFRKIEDGASIYVQAVTSFGAEGHGSFISEWRIKP
jgi:NAD(P)-dependent dehydrogenase (short-subunit alcohol dehydrogenase family)